MIGFLSSILMAGSEQPELFPKEEIERIEQESAKNKATEDAIREDEQNIRRDINSQQSQGSNNSNFFKKAGIGLAYGVAGLGKLGYSILKDSSLKVAQKGNFWLIAMTLLGILIFFLQHQVFNTFWMVLVLNLTMGAILGLLIPSSGNKLQEIFHTSIAVGGLITIIQFIFSRFESTLLSTTWAGLLGLFILYLFLYMPWVSYILFVQNSVNGWFKDLAGFFLIIFLLFVVLGVLAGQGFLQRQQFTEGASLRGEFSTLARENWALIINATVTGVERAQNRSDDVFRYATGSYEESVDRDSQIQTLGLRFKELLLSNPDGTYFQGDAVSAWGVLESRSLDRAINVNASCLVDRRLGPNLWVEGIVNNPQFTIHDLDYRDITCSFPRHTFPDVKGHTLEIFADFDFTTNSYLRRYFISQQDFTNLRSNNIDPIQFYNIPRSDETGRFTNGPIELSLIKHNLLQSIERDTDFIIGIRVDVNRRMGWTGGQLLDIQNLVISLPSGLRIKQDRDGYMCSHSFVNYPSDQCYADCLARHTAERCMDTCGEHVMYQLESTDFELSRENGIDFVKTPLIFTCTVEVVNTADVIGRQSPIGIGNFRATADYRFRTSVEKPFRIIERTGYVNPNRLDDICGFKTEHLDSNVQINVEGVANAARNIIVNPKNPEENVTISNSVIQEKSGGVICPALLKGIIALRTTQAQSPNLLGYTGITAEQLREVSAPVDEDFRETFNDITYTSQFLLNKLNTEECQLQGERIIDCALGHFLCDSSSGPCVNNFVPRVIALAKHYNE